MLMQGIKTNWPCVLKISRAQARCAADDADAAVLTKPIIISPENFSVDIITVTGTNVHNFN